MSDFNNIIDEILKTPPFLLYLRPLLQLLPPLLLPPAPSALAVLALAPLGRLFCPSRRPPVASSGDIWDVPSSNKEVEEEKEEEEEEDNNTPTSRLIYVTRHTNQCLIAIANTIL